MRARNNLYLNGAIPYKNGVNDFVDDKSDAKIRLEESEDGIYLFVSSAHDIPKSGSDIISSRDIAEAMVPQTIFENPDGTPILFCNDYFHKKSRDKNRNAVGPFSIFDQGKNGVKLWPKTQSVQAL